MSQSPPAECRFPLQDSPLSRYRRQGGRSALARIGGGVVAEALLIRAGKWTPSKEPPEIK